MRKCLSLLMSASFVLSLTGVYGDDSSTAPDTTAAQPMPNPHQATDVFLSSPDYSFAAEFTALILQPSSSRLYYAAEAFPLPVPSPNWEIYELHPDYRFGFDVGINGVFHSTNTNLMLNWEHFHSTTSSSVTVPGEDMLGPFFTIGPDASPYNIASGKVSFHFEEVSLDYGMFVSFGDRVQTNLFAGVSYAYIKQSLTSNYSSSDGTDTRSISTPSSFSGAGPQAGLSFTYRFIDGFHLVGDAAASLLVGSMKNHTTFKSVSPLLDGLDITPSNTQTTQIAKRTQVVPGFEGKLGLGYTYNFCKHYMFTLEAGYEAQIYLNAIQSTDMGSEVPLNTVEPTTVGVFARTFQRNLSNFALAGPYVTVNLGF